jgi:uncharacterized ferritin-like protein (DUF455 family)
MVNNDINIGPMRSDKNKQGRTEPPTCVQPVKIHQNPLETIKTYVKNVHPQSLMYYKENQRGNTKHT